jgi:16S rRNA (uracil1498-N3)-methyltransferase
VSVTGDEGLHLARVLRLAAGDEVELFDGRGRTFRARLVRVEGDTATARIEAEAPERDRESPLRLVMIQGLPRPQVFDGLIRKLTELGVVRIEPVIAARSPVQGLSRRRARRWERIAAEAAKQCRRSVVPDIAAPESAVVRFGCSPEGEGWIFHPAGEPLRRRLQEAAAPAMPLRVAIGPEGGWSEEEAERAGAAGYRMFTLGDRILRVETAAVLTVALAQFTYGDFGGNF